VSGRTTFFEMLDETRDGRVLVMGVCNVTPDSFSDGGAFLQPLSARARVDALVAAGADVVDIGGESTRPGAPRVPAATQLDRVLAVVRYASERTCVSIDTTEPEVAEACLAAGASCVNDVSACANPHLAEVAARHDAACILMHARGTQDKMRGFSEYPDDAYGDVVADVLREWSAAAERARSAGLGKDALVMDPGLGFDKNARHSRELLRRIDEIVRGSFAPVLVGASRKSFLLADLPPAPPADRLAASLAAATHSALHGVHALRVHDVFETLQAVAVARSLAAPAAGGAA
jgi:dihydropteroate synthase